MSSNQSISKFEQVTNYITILRGHKVMIDADLARLFKVETKRLNQAVKRNPARFPKDFMFQLTEEEKKKVVTERDHLKQLRYSPHLPHAFTEHGTLMLASVLNSPTAIEACVEVIRAFVKMREVIESHHLAFQAQLNQRIENLEHKTQEKFEELLKTVQRLQQEED